MLRLLGAHLGGAKGDLRAGESKKLRLVLAHNHGKPYCRGPGIAIREGQGKVRSTRRLGTQKELPLGSERS